MTTPRRFLAPPPAAPITPGPVPTFSVIIPAYQSQYFIADALGSALAQTLPAHEVIVCDDGSTDDLDSALAPFSDRIVLLRKPNGGIGSAKNHAARYATGDFLVWLDHDDAWMPDRLEALGELAVARPDLDILTTDAVLERDGREVGLWYGYFPVAEQRATILTKNFVYPSAAVRRSRFLANGGSDESLRIEDWDCWIRMILDGAMAGMVDAPLARYRVRRDSVSADDEKRKRNDLAVLRKVLGHEALSPAELAMVSERVETRARTIELFDLKDELLDGSSGMRKRLWAVARSSDRRLPVRIQAAVASVLPRLAARFLARRERGRNRS